MGWWTVFNVLLPSLDAPITLTSRKQQCDPLQFDGWRNGVDLHLAKGDFRAPIETIQRGLEKFSHLQVATSLIQAYIGAGEYDKAIAASERLVERDILREAFRLDVAMAQGNESEVEAMRNAILSSVASGESAELRFDKFVLIYARSGMRDAANEFVAAIDAEPLGFLALL